MGANICPPVKHHWIEMAFAGGLMVALLEFVVDPHSSEQYGAKV